MTTKYQQMAFTEAVREAQALNGSAAAYSRQRVADPPADALGADEIAFIESRDSFYMATVNAAGWPYVQHRGGPPGFLKVINPTTLAMPDFRGNRQYVSLGNLAENDRASLFFMDYPRQARLKVFARVRAIDLAENMELALRLANDAYGAKIERAFEFTLKAFDWNCPQHITPRHTETEIRAVTAKMSERIATLELEVERLRTR